MIPTVKINESLPQRYHKISSADRTGCDDDICGYMLDEINADGSQRRAELFYCLAYCVDFMGERGMTFGDKTVEVNEQVISRLDSLYDMFMSRWISINA